MTRATLATRMSEERLTWARKLDRAVQTCSTDEAKTLHLVRRSGDSTICSTIRSLMRSTNTRRIASAVRSRRRSCGMYCAVRLESYPRTVSAKHPLNSPTCSQPSHKEALCLFPHLKSFGVSSLAVSFLLDGFFRSFWGLLPCSFILFFYSMQVFVTSSTVSSMTCWTGQSTISSFGNVDDHLTDLVRDLLPKQALPRASLCSLALFAPGSTSEGSTALQ